ncbi:MiAMP1 family antimicrobial peptide [Streptomyces radiopugnans]|uniref:MiAMP1 family antimicrobial peptide n=1 Tax=Streptomyces radiopugnans TaxID=403935 RepID=UPI003F1AA379
MQRRPVRTQLSRKPPSPCGAERPSRNCHRRHGGVTAAPVPAVRGPGGGPGRAPQAGGSRRRAPGPTGCGCSNLSLDHCGSYRFDHTGQAVSMSNTRGCQRSPRYTFRGDASSPAPVGWRSVCIHC